MQFIRTEDLKPNMRLAKPIYNRMGILLYDRGSVITLSSANSIRNFGLIGVYILEPAEPVPFISKEDIQFEQHQTIFMFKLRDCLDKIHTGQLPGSFSELVDNIIAHYASLDHPINFTQNVRSSDDFMYKHSINTSLLCCMIAHQMNFSSEQIRGVVAASLLYGFGYLYVPKSILMKGTHINDQEKETIFKALEKGYEYLENTFTETQFPKYTLELIKSYLSWSKKDSSINHPSYQLSMIHTLNVANEFDKQTGMSIDYAPVSEIEAMRQLSASPELFPKEIVNALAKCIHIVPAGASVDLSNGHKAIVLVENSQDFMKPLVLCIENNQLYDLSNPVIFRHVKIIDIMKTMDNRIAINEETLKLFVADERIKEVTRRFQEKKNRPSAGKASTQKKTTGGFEAKPLRRKLM